DSPRLRPDAEHRVERRPRPDAVPGLRRRDPRGACRSPRRNRALRRRRPRPPALRLALDRHGIRPGGLRSRVDRGGALPARTIGVGGAGAAAAVGRPVVTARLALALVALAATRATANEAPRPLEVHARERLVVVAPHPDDETLGTAGLVQRVLASGGS